MGVIGGISNVSLVSGLDRIPRTYEVQTQAVEKTGNSGVVYASARALPLETPVQPVEPVKPVNGNVSGTLEPMFQRQGADPAEMAVRMRMQYVDPSTGEVIARDETGNGMEDARADEKLPGMKEYDREFGEERLTPAENWKAEQEEKKIEEEERKVEEKEQTQKEELKEQENVKDDKETKSARETMEEEECQTCEERKYQDGSDDPGVSFKTPGHIDADVAGSVVRGHEMEHVNREQAKAKLENREVLHQSVTLHNAICPECGKVYASGGTTRTVTAQVQKPQSIDKDAIYRRLGFDVVA